MLMLTLALSSSPAIAGDPEIGTLYTAVSPADVTALLDAMMLTHSRAYMEDGSPAWSLQLGGTETVLFLSDCEGTACSAVQLWAGWTTSQPVALEVLNDWNARHRFSRAYLGQDGRVHLESDLDLSGGSSLRAVIAQIRIFRASTVAFSEHLAEEPSQ